MEPDNRIEVIPPKIGVNGVKNTVSRKIADMLTNGTRYFGSAGASLTHHVSNPDYTSEFKRKVVEIGMEGERSTSLIIQRWMEDKPNAVLADSVHVRGAGKETVDKESGLIEGGDTDHVLILGDTVVLIDSKRWKNYKKYSINDKGVVLRGGRMFGGSHVHATQAKFLWKKYLDDSARIRSIVCINSHHVFVLYDKNWRKQQFRLITVENLVENLDRIYQKLSDQQKNSINSTLVSQVVVCCIKPYDGYERVFNMDTLKNFK